MKRVLLALAALAVCLLITTMAQAQATTSQSLTLAVSAVYKISVSGNPGALTINDGTAGSDNLAYAGDSSTTYSITHNNVGNLRISANLDAAMPAGYTLQITLNSTRGTGGATLDISNATAGSAVDVVTGIARGADAGQRIRYYFTTTASAGTLASTNRTVTLTLQN
jgi:hypothetical protein